MEFRTQDVLKPDKTVTKGRVTRRYCRRGKFDLMDVAPCQLYEKCDHSSARIPFPIR